MNNINDYIQKCGEVASRYVGDLNLLTLAAFNCNLSAVQSFENYCPDEIAKFEQLANTFFTTDIPTAYIVGFELFLGERITVDQNTLIPRFETEELVLNLEQRIKAKYKRGSSLAIADICSGSGVIGVSLYNRLKADYKVDITFVDISVKALSVTRINADKFGVDYQLLTGDMAAPLISSNMTFDVIVSNPPYIGYEEDVQASVLNYEPKLALYAEDDGLALYKSLISDIMKISNDEFCFMLEIGETQSAALNAFLLGKHNKFFEIIKDINGADRNLYLEE